MMSRGTVRPVRDSDAAASTPLPVPGSVATLRTRSKGQVDLVKLGVYGKFSYF